MASPCLSRLVAFLALALTASAQTVLLTPSTMVLSANGGDVTFTATLTYATRPSTLGLTITLPTGWSYVSGTSVPGTSPAEPAIAPTAGRTGELEWAFINPPTSPVTFTFTTSYPGTATGLQSLTPSTVARDGTGAPPATATAPTYNLSAPSNIITWQGGNGNWNDVNQWSPNTVPANGEGHYSATVAAGIAALNTPVSLDNLTFTGGTITGTGNLTLTALGSSWTSGVFGGLGELVIAPGAQLTAAGDGAHVFNERTIRNQGTFTWTDRGALQSGSGGAFINSSGATFADATSGSTEYSIANTGTGSFSFSNAGAYNKTGAGTTRIDIPFANTGNIVVSAGTLRFSNTFTQGGGILTVASGATLRFDNGLNFAAGSLRGGGVVTANVTNDAFISPGNLIGTLTIDGNLTLLASSHLQFDIAGTTQGSNYDFLLVRGTAALGGAFSFNVATSVEGSFLPTDTLTLLSSSSLTGTFAGIPNGTRVNATSGIASFVVTYSGSAVTLSDYRAIPEPSTWILLTSGLGALALAVRRRRL